MIDKREEINWKKCIAQYRDSIDLATLFWIWKRFESDFDPFRKLEEIVTFFPQHQILYVPPRELFGAMLGGGSLKPGEFITAEDIILSSFGARHVSPDDKERYKFDESSWGKLVQSAFESGAPCRPFDLIWMLRYRRALRRVTPFSDYQIVRRDGDSYLVFMEDGINTMPEHLLQLGIIDGSEDYYLLEGLTPNGIYAYNKIVGDVAYTHAFVNLDDFVEACDQIGYSIPDLFRSPVRSAGVTREELRKVNFEINFAKDEQFKALLIAQKVQEYLKYDIDGIRLLNEGSVSEVKSELRSKIDKAFGYQDDTLVDHIWALLMPITGNFKRHKGKKLIRNNLIAAIDKLWRGDIYQIWRLDSAEDRLITLKGMGYGANEAKAIRALLTPEVIQVSGKPSEKALQRYAAAILSVDLSWLNEPFP